MDPLIHLLDHTYGDLIEKVLRVGKVVVDRTANNAGFLGKLTHIEMLAAGFREEFEGGIVKS
ncbi:hypothetical protein GCM10017767_31660 [Halomonas urumqiensis]|nr:hypothetical protein GCM10017767_31660 [Halomonas urumqiensis]